MKIVDLVCPNCNGSIQLDEDREFGFCMHCGHRIVLAGSDIGNNRYAQLKRLKTTLDVKAQGRNQNEIIKLCDRIIELDPNDSDAWYYKGLYALQDGIVSEALPYWTKSVEGMCKEEARELQNIMVEAVADALFSDVEDNIPLLSLLSLCVEMDNKTQFTPDEEPGDFLAELIDKMLEETINLEDSPTIQYHVSAITIVLMSIVSRFGSIIVNRNVLSAIAEVLTEIRDDMSRISFSDSGLINRDRDEVSRNIAFIKRVVSEIDHAMESHTEEEVERLSNYWVEQEMSDFMDYLLEARSADIELASAGIMSASKYKKERNEKIQAFLDTYFEPLKKGLC